MKIDLFDLTGEVAVVIGATGVLGGAIAEGLGTCWSESCRVGRSSERGARRVHSILDQGGTAEFFADALDRSSLESARASVAVGLEFPTILVNAAGGNDPSVIVSPELPFEKIAVADWRNNFDLNLIGGALLPCQEFGAGIKKKTPEAVLLILLASLPTFRCLALLPTQRPKPRW
jgi:NAD(P)-dependent dehydrogenase (short-subunit alcohol dehydrogenase family)